MFRVVLVFQPGQPHEWHWHHVREEAAMRGPGIAIAIFVIGVFWLASIGVPVWLAALLVGIVAVLFGSFFAR
jgi:hypothetical protein